MRNALYDFSWEIRIMCTLSCFIAFMGGIAVYGFLWSMLLWEQENKRQGYMYINKDSYNQIYVKSSNPNKERKLKKPFIPNPKGNNNIEMQERDNNNEEEEDEEE